MESNEPISKVEEQNKCVICESTEDVNWFCNDCQEALCDHCKEGHKRGKKTRNDDVVHIQQANKLSSEAVLPHVCKIHPGKLCDLFCTECLVVMCSWCFTQKHMQHTFKDFEDEVASQKQYLYDQLKTMKYKLDRLKENIANRQKAIKSFKESVDIIQKDVKEHGSKLKVEIDSIVGTVLEELSSLIDEEDKIFKHDCLPDEFKAREIEKFIREVEQHSEIKSGEALFELTRRISAAIPGFDVTKRSVPQCLPTFVTGQFDSKRLKAMIGHFQHENEKWTGLGYERKEINSQHVKHLSTFRVPKQDSIVSICPSDDAHAWISVNGSKELIQVDKMGEVHQSVQIDFEPWSLALTTTQELLMTRNDVLPVIHKLSADRRVKTFANTSPAKAWNVTVSDRDEVFVSTNSRKILVLNMYGDKIKQLSCGHDWCRIVYLTAGYVAVTTDDVYWKNPKIISKSDKVIHTWSGKLDNGQSILRTGQNSIACDMYGRVFAPDTSNDQVYVLPPQNDTRVLLDKKHGITSPTAVCVDKCGDIWIGCIDGTVHVMQL